MTEWEERQILYDDDADNWPVTWWLYASIAFVPSYVVWSILNVLW